ncbi:F-box domain containing protein [Tanacetum coccineum]
MKEEFLDCLGSQIRQQPRFFFRPNDQDPEVRHNQRIIRLLMTNMDSNLNKLLRCRRCELQEILEFKYLLFKVVLFRVKWFDTRNQGRKVKRLVLRNNMTQIDTRAEAFKDDQYILVTQVKQVFYLEDKAKPYWRVVEHVNHKKFSDGGVIVVEDDPDIIHFDNSSDLPLSTSLNDLDNATLHIDGQSTEVDAPPDIIDVVDQDDDITDDEDALPHDLADSDDEDLINVDDDDVARSHGGDGGGEDRPPPHHVPSGCMGCFANRGESLGVLLCTTFLAEVPKGAEGRAMTNIGTEINAGIQQHLQKAYNTNKAAFKAQHWVIDPTTGTYDVEKNQAGQSLRTITAEEWEKYIKFWNDHRNIARAAQNRQNRAKSTVISRQGSRSLARLRDEMFESGGASGSGGCGDDEESVDDQEDEDEDGDGNTSVPQRLVAGERYPQRQVDGESPEFSPGKRANVVVSIAMAMN